MDHRRAHERRRATSTARGYDRHWARARRRFLSQPEHLYCVACRSAWATVVDHRIPHRGNHQLFWDTTNWQPLCDVCHNRKTGAGQ